MLNWFQHFLFRSTPMLPFLSQEAKGDKYNPAIKTACISAYARCFQLNNKLKRKTLCVLPAEGNSAFFIRED